jgi:hypothetical protein
VIGFYRVYQYVVPLVFFPLSYWLWLRRYDGDHGLAALALSVPIVFSYVVPGLGTNWLKLWEINTRWRIGRFRPQHGFLFGTATSWFGLLCLEFPPAGYAPLDWFRSAFVMGSVLAFWNWFYDYHALRVGFLKVYNRRYAEDAGPAAIAADYCPVFFGSFGVCYGLAIRVSEYWLIERGASSLYWPLLIGLNLLTLVTPVVVFVLFSLASTGETGLRSYQRS